MNNSFSHILQRDMFLVNLLLKNKRITFSSINEHWRYSHLYIGEDICFDTFYYRISCIEEYLGLRIMKKGGYYYIDNPEVLRNNCLKNFYISALTFYNEFVDIKTVADYILIDDLPCKNENMLRIAKAMKTSNMVNFNYTKYEGQPDFKLVHPYFLKYYHQRWYLMAWDIMKGFRVFALDRMSDLHVSHNQFRRKDEYDAEELFGDLFGVVYGIDMKPEEVILLATSNEACYLRDTPIHHSQREIGNVGSDVKFSLYLKNTNDFIAYIVSRGNRLRVLAPESLKQRVIDFHRKALEGYDVFSD